MVPEGLTLEAAIDDYLGSIGGMTASSRRGYKAALEELSRFHPEAVLREFEPPAGSGLIRHVLEECWGQRAPRTFNKNLSILREFFAWHLRQGNLESDPAGLAIERKPVDRESRSALTLKQRDAILAANSAPWDSVPLRLLLDIGVQKGSLRRLTFRDFDHHERLVVVVRGRRRDRLYIADDAFWIDFSRLQAYRNSVESDFVFPEERSNWQIPLPEERDAMDEYGALDEGNVYFWQRYDGLWLRATVNSERPRGEHGAQTWWYRCLGRAGVVGPGVESGLPMSTARHTVGRSLLARTGSLKEVQKQLGVGSGGSTGDVYSNRDADQLEATIRRVARALRQTPKPLATLEPAPDNVSPWWRDPVDRLLDYITEERNLVELSRVSIEMLRSQNGRSRALQQAASTLTRVVDGATLIERAKVEAADDHPLLHGHSLVAVWGALETMAIDIVIGWLQHRPGTRMAAYVSDIKVPYLQFEAMTAEERAAGLAQEIDRQKGAKLGIDRFERLLEAVGLAGSRDEVLAQNIYELQQIRNLFAHKSGVADRRFVDACPYLGYRIGERVVVDRGAWSDFMVTALNYADLLRGRMMLELGFANPSRQVEIRPIRYPPREAGGGVRIRTRKLRWPA
jgi:integrase